MVDQTRRNSSREQRLARVFSADLGRHHKALAVLFSDDPGSLIKRRVVVQRDETDARELVGQVTDGLVLIALALHIQRPAADAGQEDLPSAGLLRRKFSDCFFLDLLTAPGRDCQFGVKLGSGPWSCSGSKDRCRRP